MDARDAPAQLADGRSDVPTPVVDVSDREAEGLPRNADAIVISERPSGVQL
jgi:hypothetical protein